MRRTIPSVPVVISAARVEMLRALRLFGLLLGFGLTQGQAAQESAPLVIQQVAPNPLRPGIQPEVFVVEVGDSTRRIATNGMPLTSSSVVTNGGGGSSIIEDRATKTQYRLGRNTSAAAGGSSSTNGVWLRLLEGTMRWLGYYAESRTAVIPNGNLAVTHTEFEVEAEPERTRITVFDGEVRLSNEWGERLVSGRAGLEWGQAVVSLGEAPRPLAATNLVQWWLYYPGVLDVGELNLSDRARERWAQTLTNYSAGDLPAALQAEPAEAEAEADEPDLRIYRAALRLAAGRTDEAQALVRTLGTDSSLARAIETLLAAVTRTPISTSLPPASASEYLARSYYLQSIHDLAGATEAARGATNSPDFGYAWVRLADLKFSDGRIREATDLLRNGLRLNPRNAQALALLGYLEAAQNRRLRALSRFDEAIWLDSRLANAWLGRGLCRVRGGDIAGGLADLRTAAALEPNRAVIRSYLAKALQQVGDFTNALKQLRIAKDLDARDPTGWLYGALVLEDLNRFNEGITNLERSVDLNRNRTVYRSAFRLDEDHAVRSAGLARLYRRDGLTEVSLREAAQAVAADYLAYSSHLFLAESYDALRDPARFNLKYETAWSAEMLLANWLAPVGAGVLSPNISQQEYSRLFQQDGLSLTSVSEYRSDGQFRQLALQSGTFGKTAWSFDLDYGHNEGTRPNNDLDRIEWYSQVKQQIGPSDTALALIKYQSFSAGDNNQYAYRTDADPDFRLTEDQKPIVLGGWRHEWTPDSQTLVLGGRLAGTQRWTDADHGVWTKFTSSTGNRFNVRLYSDLAYLLDDETYTVEAVQLQKFTDHTLIAGARAQFGSLAARATFTNPDEDLSGSLTNRMLDTTSSEDLRRYAVYVYDQWTPIRSLALTAGLTWDHLEGPENFRSPPLAGGEFDRSRLLPKAAILWNAAPWVTFRAMYAESLGGVSFDESVRLEPAQLAGFGQAYRTIIPESEVGSVQAHDLELGAAAVDLKFPTGTYAGIEGRWAQSRVDQAAGFFSVTRVRDADGKPTTQPIEFSNGPQSLRFDERELRVSLDQLLGTEWSLGGAYRLVDTRLDETQPAVGFRSDAAALLNEAQLRLGWNHSSGVFATIQSLWLWQSVDRQATPGPAMAPHGEEQINQVNVEAGWRFHRYWGPRLPVPDDARMDSLFRESVHGELALGVLDIFDQGHHLDPLSGYRDLPQDAVFYVRLKLDF